MLKLCDDGNPAASSVVPLDTSENDLALSASADLFDVQQLCEDVLASVTEDVCRPLRSRVEQILLLEQSPLVLHRLAALVRFYTGTIKQVSWRAHFCSLPTLTSSSNAAYWYRETHLFLGGMLVLVLFQIVGKQTNKAFHL